MTISLQKRQTINLEKSNGQALTQITMGLGWDVAKKVVQSKGFLGFGGGTKVVEGESIDLDASVVGFDAQGNPLEHIYFGKLSGFGGAIQHNGDNRTGAGDGDDETIDVDLTQLPANVKSLVFTVNSFQGQTFDQIENAVCRLLDQKTQQEIARIDLSAKGRHTGVIMAKVFREGNGWKVQSLAEIGEGRTFKDMLPHIRSLL